MKIQRASTEGQPSTKEAALNAGAGVVLIILFGVIATLVVCGVVGLVALVAAL